MEVSIAISEAISIGIPRNRVNRMYPPILTTTPEVPVTQNLINSFDLRKRIFPKFVRNSSWSRKESLDTPYKRAEKTMGISTTLAPFRSNSKRNEDWKEYPRVERFEKSHFSIKSAL